MGKNLRFLALFSAAGLLVYANSVTGAFQYDDAHSIQTNPFVHDLGFLADYFVDGRTSSALPENSGYRPLSTAAFALCWAIGGGATWPFHLYKIVAHILAAWLIFLIGSALMRKGERADPPSAPLELFVPGRGNILVSPEIAAAIPAVLFLVHPGLSETVNYLVQTSTLQCAVFYLAAFHAFTRWRAPGVLGLAWMAAAFAASLLSKEEGATFPAALVLYALVFRDRSTGWADWFKRIAWPLAVSLVVLGAYLAVYLTFKPASGAQSMADVSAVSYLLTQVWAWIYYLVWIVTPWGYGVEHAHFGFSRKVYEPRVLAGIVLNVLILRQAVRWIPNRPQLAFGILWYYLTILPSSSVFPLAEPINEHRYYLSYSLLFAALGHAALQALRRLDFLALDCAFAGAQRTIVLMTHKMRPYALSAALAVVVTLLGAITIGRNAVWRTPLSLWSDAVARDPDNGRAHNNLATVYATAGDWTNSLSHAELCARKWPAYKYCYLNQHVAYLSMNRPLDARVSLDQALRLDPEFVVGQWYLARHQLDSEKAPERALATLDRCDRSGGGKYVPCLELMVKALAAAGRDEDVLRVGDRLLAIAPRNRDAAFSMGMSLINLKRLENARRIFGYLVAVNGRDTQAMYNLAWAEMQLQNWEAARGRWQQAVALAPDTEGAWMNLRIVAEQLKDTELVQRCDQELRRIRGAK